MDAVQDYEFRKAKLWYKIWQEETLLAVETDAQKKIARAENVANLYLQLAILIALEMALKPPAGKETQDPPPPPPQGHSVSL